MVMPPLQHSHKGKKIRIAFFHELQFGGARRVVLEHIKELVRRGHDVDLYYTNEEKDKELEKIAHVAFHLPFFPKKWKGHDWKTRLYKDSLELWKLSSHHQHIAELINNKKYDIVVVHPSQFTQAPFLLRFVTLPTLYYCQEPLRLVYDEAVKGMQRQRGVRFLYEKGNEFIRKWIDSNNIHRATTIAVNSLFTKQNVFHAYGLSSQVVYLGVDTDFFHPIRGENIYDIGFIGAPEYIEGYDLLASLEHAHPNWKIHVTKRDHQGKGITDRELVRLYNQCKVIVCLSRNEPFGLVPLEAAACEIPVVAIEEGGYTETIQQGKTGYLVPRDCDTVEEKIAYLLDHSKEREQFGKNARVEMNKNWTWKQSTTALEKLINKTVQKEIKFSWKEWVHNGFVVYVSVVVVLLLIVRFSFRFLRTLFIAPSIIDGTVGYAQYFGYPFSFEAYLFGMLFLIPVIVAIGLFLWSKRR
ncbi:hypothetical protein C5B42_00325 [Candidatus Cerribacteria bacterium 'Amazon FNV 2010 28 9']|uniref:Uncharacterized protein n=1 Tax=Candidatus Cerribacteria bacterium 'Amazon FNV 2010 28 9' TaxID=2081795 RepID=A0A317JRQ9_9BACT|nr:MAG: hypothetical protein C5B42_00325 [Candidatus Cerribacteria bacterium 'Amazon FNV 2010 28 9']